MCKTWEGGTVQIYDKVFCMQKMAKRARLTTEQVLEGWEDFETEVEDDLDTIREPVMPGSDDELSDFDEMLAEEEETNCERPEVQDVQREENDDVCMERDVELDMGNDESRNDNSDRNDTGNPSTLLPRNGATWSSPAAIQPVHPFTSPVGPITTIPDNPLDAFLLTFTPDLIAMIVRESNRYAREVMGEKKYTSWEPMTDTELRAYLGFSILMGIVHVPAVEDHWKRDPALHYSPIADRISRDRFRDLSRYLHFVDNSTLIPRGSPGHDRLGKIRPVLSHLGERFAGLYNPHRELSEDEAMIKFQGRSYLKQYMPMKPTKRGIKVWVLADSHNGYFSRLEVYTGKQGDRVETGLGSRVVKSLTADFKGKHHMVFFDNFFTSYTLLEDLLEDGVYGCGTARKDHRGFPKELKNLKLKERYSTITQL